MVRILIVEDEAKVARALREGLSGEGHEVSVCANGHDGLARAIAEPHDAIVLDIMLPGMSGLDLLRALRRRGVATPVLLLTARDTIPDRVDGLDSGADDYLVKPFAFAELLARLRALLRRGKGDTGAPLVVADMRLDPSTRSVTRAGLPIELTLREYELLEYLVRNKGHLVAREMLMRDVWKDVGRATSLDNVIDVHMARLRKKVDHDHAVKLIQTVRGVGFMIREESS